MTPSGRRSALVLGAISRDLLVTDAGSPKPCPGGGVHHAGLALTRLGARTRIVTRLNPDDEKELLAPLREQGVEILALPSRRTTSYLNDYRSSVDQHELRAASDPIRPADIPAHWKSSQLIQLSPLHANDIVGQTAGELHGFKGLDVQGLLREPGQAGLAALALFLPHIDVLQASESDLGALLGGESPERFARRWSLREMLVTRGARGAALITLKETIDVPTRPLRQGERVGAGDVFLACYLYLRVSGHEPAEAASGATRATRAKIEHGLVPTGFFPQEQRA